MEALHTAHIESITQRFTQDIRKKYERGQREHGGNLWTKPGMMPNLRAEILDFVVYQDTLQEQLKVLLEAMRQSTETAQHICKIDMQQYVDQLQNILYGESD